MLVAVARLRVQDEVGQRLFEADVHVVTQILAGACAHEAGFDPLRSGLHGAQVVLDGLALHQDAIRRRRPPRPIRATG